MKGPERPPVPEIPGLNKGKIEIKRELWASRLRSGFPERKTAILVIGKEMEYFLDLPVLGIPESRPKPNESPQEKRVRRLSYPAWMPRVEPLSGAVFTTRWQTPLAPDNPDLVAYGGANYYEGVKLGELPKSWEVAQVIPQRLTTIEAAMRQQDEVRHDMSVATGVEQRRVEELLMALQGISQAFLLRSEITPVQLQGLSLQAENLLKEHGLLSARDTIWKKIAEYTLRATSKDSSTRMVRRVLARAAYLAAIKRELIQRASREKADKIYFYLQVTRGDNRFRIESAVSVLDQMAGFSYGRALPALNGDNRWMSPREALAIEQGVRAIARDILAPIEAAPYLASVRKAEAILVGNIGKSNKEVERLNEVLDEEGKRELKRKSAADYLKALDATSAKKRMLQGFKVLNQIIHDPDTFEITVFE
jgi:hypothetical protein